MKKNEFVTVIAEKTGATKKESEYWLDSIFDIVKDLVAKGEKVSVSRFGTFEAKERKARECINPKTKEKILVAAKKTPSFKAGKDFKNTVANS